MKILVIEDDALLLQGLILAMQSEGYVCDGVSTAHEAALSLAFLLGWLAIVWGIFCTVAGIALMIGARRVGSQL